MEQCELIVHVCYSVVLWDDELGRKAAAVACRRVLCQHLREGAEDSHGKRYLGQTVTGVGVELWTPRIPNRTVMHLVTYSCHWGVMGYKGTA